MELISVSSSQTPLDWNSGAQKKLHAFASEQDIDRLWTSVFEPYAHGYNAILADEMNRDELKSFIGLLGRFRTTIAKTDALHDHIPKILDALNRELEIRCPR